MNAQCSMIDVSLPPTGNLVNGCNVGSAVCMHTFCNTTVRYTFRIDAPEICFGVQFSRYNFPGKLGRETAGCRWRNGVCTMHVRISTPGRYPTPVWVFGSGVPDACRGVDRSGPTPPHGAHGESDGALFIPRFSTCRNYNPTSGRRQRTQEPKLISYPPSGRRRTRSRKTRKRRRKKSSAVPRGLVDYVYCVTDVYRVWGIQLKGTNSQLRSIAYGCRRENETLVLVLVHTVPVPFVHPCTNEIQARLSPFLPRPFVVSFSVHARTDSRGMYYTRT